MISPPEFDCSTTLVEKLDDLLRDAGIEVREAFPAEQHDGAVLSGKTCEKNGGSVEIGVTVYSKGACVLSLLFSWRSKNRCLAAEIESLLVGNGAKSH